MCFGTRSDGECRTRASPLPATGSIGGQPDALEVIYRRSALGKMAAVPQ
jgi:hypothetical protein